MLFLATIICHNDGGFESSQVKLKLKSSLWQIIVTNIYLCIKDTAYYADLEFQINLQYALKKSCLNAFL